MANNLHKYMRLFLILVKINYLKAMEYRIDFFSTILPTGMYSVGYVVFIGAILTRIPSILGWSFHQMLMLFAVEQLFYYTSWIFYRRSIDAFPTLIRNGTFDMVAKMPINARFMVSFREQSPDVVIPFLGATAVLVYASWGIPFSLTNMAVFCIFLVMGIILLYNIIFALASLSFWTTDADEFIGFVDEVLSFGRYPLKIFPSFVGLFLLAIIPAVLMVYVPATAILGILDWKLGFFSLVMVLVTYYVSERIWRAGLRYYSSASS
jgi:ABC-2 type transport system permease protein